MKQKGFATHRLVHGFAPLIIILIIVVLGAGGFVAYKNKDLIIKPSKLTQVLPSTVPALSPLPPGVIPTTIPTTSPSGEPVVTSPAAGSQVRSPLIVRGTVPSNWMFEGVLGVKLVDSNHKLIVQESGREVIPSSWTGTSPVAFEATLTFSTSATSGYLLIENDNPSGLPANSKTFEVPVNF